METETLDKMYLEWSQFTRARTAREVDTLALLHRLDRRGGLGHATHEEIQAVIIKLSV